MRDLYKLSLRSKMLVRRSEGDEMGEVMMYDDLWDVSILLVYRSACMNS
jgi:hypothetical protein